MAENGLSPAMIISVSGTDDRHWLMRLLPQKGWLAIPGVAG
jgi:hypothetical protein